MISKKQSKYLALLLRHKPEQAGLLMDSEGWVDIDELVKHTKFTKDVLTQLVEEDDKMRYCIAHNKIRANQGHSLDYVTITMAEWRNPSDLYHGTTREAWKIIKTEGLQKMGRRHVHLSENMATARLVAARRKDESIMLKVLAGKMMEDGYVFEVSENNVILIDSVPSKYIRRVLDFG